jgi:hypothetical protein
MVRYGIALDGSSTAEKALKYVTHTLMNKKKDELYLIGVTERLVNKFPATPTTLPIVIEAQQKMEEDTELLLKKYGKQCRSWGVR